MIVARGLGRAVYLGAVVAVGLCITAPATVEVAHTGGAYYVQPVRVETEKSAANSIEYEREIAHAHITHLAVAGSIDMDWHKASPILIIGTAAHGLLGDEITLIRYASRLDYHRIAMQDDADLAAGLI